MQTHNQPLRQLFNKVPEVTLFFWVIKILATTVGETAADFLNVNLNFGLTGTSTIMAALLTFFLILQVRGNRYVPWLYWLTVVLISIVGTLVTDNLVDHFGVSLETTTLLFSVALAVTFALWYLVEKSLSIHTIFTVRRELFYWAAILFTFALGTAAGDLVSESMNLGYLNSALLFGGMIATITASYYLFHSNAVLSFWCAYILTRPFGASCGDLLSQSPADGGLGLGTVATSAIFLTTIAGLVGYLSTTQRGFLPPRIPEK